MRSCPPKTKRAPARLLSFVASSMVGLAVVTGGCGALSLDSVTFDLPPQSYTFSSAPLGLPTGTFPSATCRTAGDCCPAATAVGLDCALLTCNGACSLRLLIESSPQPVNLSTVPALGALKGRSITGVVVKQIKYVANSTLNVGLPQTDLYVAPSGTAVSTDPAAKKFGTVPTLPPDTSGTQGLVGLEPDVDATLGPYVTNTSTPFVFLASTVMIIHGGEPLPAGSLDMTITGRVTIKLGP